MNKPNHNNAGLIRRTLLALASLALLISMAHAQAPTMISYQSRVLMNNANFNGTGQFKFALVRGPGPTLLWKSDGSAGNTEPAAAVSLPVANGLVMTSLGDATLANMTAIPVSVFENYPDVRLRVWFNGGVGYQQLTPDQRIVSVGYALMANAVPDGSITAAKLANNAITSAKITDGSIGAADLAPNSVNTGHIIDGQVMTPDIANNAVTSAQLADSIDLGANNVNGRLDVYRTTAGTPGVSLIGGSSQISTYGSDGQEQIRLWGASYGELLLNNSGRGNSRAVRLTAHGTSGGQLELNNSGGSIRALLEGENDGGTLTLRQANGNIGSILYGNDAGGGALSLRATNGSPRLRAYGGPTAGSLILYNNAGATAVDLYTFGGREGVVSVRNNAGAETVYLWGRDSDGTGDGQIGLKKAAGTETITMQAGEGADGAQILMRNAAGVQTIQLDSDASGLAGGYLALYKSTGSASIILDATDGTIRGQVVEITGGSDFSEKFDINGETLEPGMIVSIDPKNPGQLTLTDSAHDKKVAGIVSGAGGVKPGMLMGQRGSIADGKHPVALSGRVFCWVDADANGAIEPGDMLTTSATPGHGMKVTDHARSTGAVVGKAMTGLEKGKGLVLVLVNLQ